MKFYSNPTMKQADGEKEDGQFITNLVHQCFLKSAPMGIDAQEWESACKTVIRGFWNQQRASFATVCTNIVLFILCYINDHIETQNFHSKIQKPKSYY